MTLKSLACAGVVLLGTALLGDETNAVSSLPPVTVTATPITQEESVSPDGADRTVVSRSQLDALNAQDLPTALRQVPGVTISRYAPVGSYGGAQGGSVYVRGMGTARPGGEVRMYTDGAPRSSGMWSHPLMDSMPVDFADSVVVQKSPHPGRFSDTFGAVDVTTRQRRTQGHEGEIDLAYGRYNTFLSSVSAGAKEDIADAYGGLSYKYSDGLRDHNTSILKSAFARTGIDLSANDHLAFIYQRTDSRVQDPGEITSATPRTDRFDLDTDLYNLRFDADHENFKGYTLLFFERGNVDWYQDNLCTLPTGAHADGNAHTEWLNFGFRTLYDWTVWRALTISFGADLSDENGETETRNLANGKTPFATSGRLDTVSPYLGARYAFELDDDWTLTPSIGSRYYFHSQYDNEWSPTAALSLDYRKDFQLFVNGSRGVHYPGVYTKAVSTDYARDTLDAETMNYVSGGFKLTPDDSWDVLACVFHTDAQNRIDKTAKGYINAGGMRASGVELSGHVRPVEPLAFFASLTYTAPETRPVSRLPAWTATVGGTWQICRYLKWSLDGQFIDRMYAYSMRSDATSAELSELGEALVINTRLAVPLDPFWSYGGEIYVSLENLTDRDYEYYPNYPMGGLMWYVGCKVKF